MHAAELSGVHVYAATPFKGDDLSVVDLDALASNLEFLVGQGVRHIAVAGGTGEVEALSEEELTEVVHCAAETIGGRAVLLAGLPANWGTAVQLADRFEAAGAQVLVPMAPLVRGRAPSPEGVVYYFRELAKACPLPVMAYNQLDWPLEVFEGLAEIPSIIGIKDTCKISPHVLFRAIKLLGDRFIWIGNKRHDPGVLHLRYQMGIDGFSSGFSNFLPGPELELHAAAQRHDWARMIELQDQLSRLEQLRLAADDAAAVKAAMDLVGLRGGSVRPPRVNLTPEIRAQLQGEVKGLLEAFSPAATHA